MILLTHPQHGLKHAYSEAEAVADEKNGWRRAQPETVRVVAQPTPERAKSLSQQYWEKFGKLPHHRMKPESIEKALNETAH